VRTLPSYRWTLRLMDASISANVILLSSYAHGIRRLRISTQWVDFYESYRAFVRGKTLGRGRERIPS